MIEVAELAPPPDVEPLQWYLLTTHEIGDAASAWRIVTWYKKRWTIEQFFRILKTQRLRIDDSRIEPPIACSSSPRLPPKPLSSLYSWCRRPRRRE
ncbi:MAG: transposase [Rhodomicrobiaceae bacterium]